MENIRGKQKSDGLEPLRQLVEILEACAQDTAGTDTELVFRQAAERVQKRLRI